MKSIYIALSILVCIAVTYVNTDYFKFHNIHANISVDHYKNRAPITIDGYIDEWSMLNLQVNKIAELNSSEMFSYTNTGNNDISGEVRFLSDPFYLYVSVSVNDDSVITDMEKPIKGYENDSVMFRFGDNRRKDKGDIKELRVVMNNDGSNHILGNPSTLEMDIPYFWEAFGVKAGCKQIYGGYTIEIAIPYTLLSWVKSPKYNTLLFDVIIFDNDHENKYGMTDHLVYWSIDDDTNINKRKEFKIISHGQNIECISENTNKAANNKYIVDNINTKQLVKQHDLMSNILSCIKRKNWEKVLTIIEPYKEEAWSKPLNVIANLHCYDFENGFAAINNIIATSSDAYIKQWAKEYPFFLADEWLIKKKNYNYAAYLLMKYIETKDDRLAAPKYKNLGVCIENIGYLNLSQYVCDINILQYIERYEHEGIYRDNIYLSLARCYFYKNDYYNSERISKYLINTSSNEHTKYYSKMVLESILNAQRGNI